MKRNLKLTLFLTLSTASMAQVTAASPTPCQPAKIFSQVSGMPVNQLLETMSALHHDGARWRKTINQIAVGNQQLPIDTQVRSLMGDVNESLADLDRSTATVVRCPNLSEIVAVTIDLSRLHENLLSISGLMTLAQTSSSAIQARAVSSALQVKSDRWQQVVKDVTTEVQPYRDGLESYTFHLSTAIDDHLLKQAGK